MSAQDRQTLKRKPQTKEGGGLDRRVYSFLRSLCGGLWRNRHNVAAPPAAGGLDERGPGNTDVDPGADVAEGLAAAGAARGASKSSHTPKYRGVTPNDLTSRLRSIRGYTEDEAELAARAAAEIERLRGVAEPSVLVLAARRVDAALAVYLDAEGPGRILAWHDLTDARMRLSHTLADWGTGRDCPCKGCYRLRKEVALS